MTPTVIFGAGGIGAGTISQTWSTAESVSDLLDTLQTLGIKQLDSAASYPPGAPWVADTLLGQAKAVERGFLVDTKIAAHEGLENSLAESSINSSLEKSLELLNVERVHVLYAHAPDPTTSIAETARAFDEQFRAGKFEKLGLCNYTAKQLNQYLEVCNEEGYVKPMVYQGHYNALFRHYERSLFPLLRENGIVFNAYSPLAGGFLTGKVTPGLSSSEVDLSKTRWAEGKTVAGYPAIYNQDQVHTAVRRAYNVLSEHGISLTEAGLRWLMHHSALAEGGGIILGATKIKQLQGNVGMCRKGPMKGEVLSAMEDMWESVQGTIANIPHNSMRADYCE